MAAVGKAELMVQQLQSQFALLQQAAAQQQQNTAAAAAAANPSGNPSRPALGPEPSMQLPDGDALGAPLSPSMGDEGSARARRQPERAAGEAAAAARQPQQAAGGDGGGDGGFAAGLVSVGWQLGGGLDLDPQMPLASFWLCNDLGMPLEFCISER